MNTPSPNPQRIIPLTKPLFSGKWSHPANTGAMYYNNRNKDKLLTAKPMLNPPIAP